MSFHDARFREAQIDADLAEVANLFTYHKPTEADIEVMTEIRNHAKVLAEYVVSSVPRSADRSAAIRKLREFVMTVNAGIACAAPTEAAKAP
jgi:hypothetical protein